MSKYIKFSCECVTADLTSFGLLAELNVYRRKLLDLGLIGVDSNGIGFGNMSLRDDATDNFHITGSATGGLDQLTLANCAKVVTCDFDRNLVQYEGSAMPSSESLTHAAIYKSDTAANAVIHCHDSVLWAAHLNHVPTTPKPAEYGTPELAHAIKQLFAHTDVRKRKIVVMGGHEGGLLTFGKDLREAFAVLTRAQNEI